MLSVSNGTFSYNSASGAHDDNGATAGGTITNATALNWAAAVGTAPTVGTQTIDLGGELLTLAGTASIDVFGFFTGQFSSRLIRRRVGDRRCGRWRELAGRGAVDDVVARADGSDVTIGPAGGPHLVIHDGTKLASRC